jgi:excisionase family DNA binding protein
MTEDRQSAVVQPLLLRADEAAIVLGIGRTKVFEMMASGELPAIKIGRCIRVPKDRLEKWIVDRTDAHRISEPEIYLQPGLTTDRQRLIIRSK